MEIENFKFVDGRLPENERHVWDFFIRKDTQDKEIIGEVILNNTYQVGLMLQMAGIDKPKAIVDLGAHIGSFTKSTALYFPETSIFSYEATEENFKLLEMNTENLSNVKIQNSIVCGSRKPAKIWWDQREKQGGMNTGGTRILYEGDEYNNDLEDTILLDDKVSSTSLEEIIENNNLDQIDYLKMDIEGSEYDVIKAARKSGVLKKVKCLVCELHVNPKRGRFMGDFISNLDEFKAIRMTNNNNYRIVYAIQ